MNVLMEDEKEKKDQWSAFLLSLLVYASLLGMLYFLKLSYKKPDPVPMGIEVNFGTDLVGSGNIQTTNKADASKNNYDVKPPAKEEKKEIEKSASKPIIKPTPPKPEPIKERIKPTKTAPEKPVLTSKDGPVEAKESKKPNPKPSPPTPIEKPSTKPIVESKPAPVSPPKPTPAPPARSVDNGSIYKKATGGSTSGGSNGTIGNRDGVGGNSNGDDKPGTVGDKGNPKGTLDGKSLYGTPGAGGGGASVNIAGWKRRKLELPDDGSAETGKIVFRVKVDDKGDVISINAIEKSVSPKVVEFYKRKIMERLSGVLDPDGTPPAESSGTITILLK